MENKMDLDLLKDIKTPNDKYISILRNSLTVVSKPSKIAPFQNCITLKFIKNKHVRLAADVYIKDLLKKEVLGVLYNANKHCLIVPLNLEFNGDMVLDVNDKNDILNEMDALAEQHFKPWDSNFEITKIELLYFFVLLLNPHLNWITVDFVLGCNRLHAYLVTSPRRKIEPSPCSCVDTSLTIFRNAIEYTNNFQH